MIPRQFSELKNSIVIRGKTNFKTNKLKKLGQHNNDPKLQTHEYLRINQIIKSSSPLVISNSVSISVSGSIDAIPLIQTVILTLQRSTVISTSFLKMSLIILLFLSIFITSHIVNCHAILNNRLENRDSTQVFFIYFNKNSSNSFNNMSLSNKSLIGDSDKNVNSLKNNRHANIMCVNNKNNFKTTSEKNSNYFILWPNKWKSHMPKIEYVHTTPTPIIHIINKTNENDALVKYNLNLIPTASSQINYPLHESEQLIKIVMDGLGLKTLPDFKKANISQKEYTTKYNEYLERIRKKNIQDFDRGTKFDVFSLNASSLSLVSVFHNSSHTKLFRKRRSPTRTKRRSKSNSTKSILLRFPLELGSDIKASDIEEANIRLLLITSPALAISKQSKRRHGHVRQKNKKNGVDLTKKQNHTIVKESEIETENKKSSKAKKNPIKKSNTHFLNMKVYQLLEPKGKVWIDGQKIEITFDRNKMDESTSQWLQFDVTKAVEEWIVNKKQNLGLEIRCDNCLRIGARIIDDTSGNSEEEENSNESQKYDLTPVLNIIGRLGTHREKRSKHYHNKITEKQKSRTNLKTNCYKDNQRCCRHSMEVVFKEIKGFEFIIQPKVFDAGYCRGRCPPRYNPAHHHALLQSLIWKQDKKKVPRPCCAPSKLVELEVLHVDEKDNEKLKISTWTDMRVLECACS